MGVLPQRQLWVVRVHYYLCVGATTVSVVSWSVTVRWAAPASAAFVSEAAHMNAGVALRAALSAFVSALLSPCAAPQAVRFVVVAGLP